MNVIFKVGDIIQEPTEGLVCSGNVQLNMSGGVNGALLLGGGDGMQVALHSYLREIGKRFVEPGFCISIGPEPFHFKSIVYTVAIDAFYDSSTELVTKSLTNAFLILCEKCKTIAVPALATGYGHLSKSDFGIALQQCIKERNWPFSEIRVVLRSESDLIEVQGGFESLTDG